MVVSRGSSRFRRVTSTLHVLTVHHREPRWIPIQARFLQLNVGMPYRVWAVVDGIAEEERVGLDVVVEHPGKHADRLNHLADLVLAEASDHDLILFLDSDAWPIAPIAELARSAMTITAVRRDENVGDRQPHPCFALTSVGFWRDLGGDWRRGHPWVNAAGWSVSDVGGRVLHRLERRGIPWRPLLRVNGMEQGLWFAIYGDADLGPIAYHHGAGSRARSSRYDTHLAMGDHAIEETRATILEAKARLLADEERAAEQAERSGRALRLIETEERFWLHPDWPSPLLPR